MTDYREILRLRSLGINHSQIALSMGISRQTVVTVLLSQRAKTDKTARHQHKSFTHKEKPDRMIHDPAEEQVKQTMPGP